MVNGTMSSDPGECRSCICYLLTRAYQACAVPLEGDPVMCLRHLDEPSFLERSWLCDYVTFADWEDPVQVLARTLAGRGCGLAYCKRTRSLQSPHGA